MKAGETKLFEELMPPAGGLGQLRARLDQEPARQRRRRAAAAAGGALVAAGIILAVLLIPSGEPGVRADLDAVLAACPAAVRLGLADAPAEPVSVAPGQRHRLAVQRVEVADQNVLYYRVIVVDRPSS